MVILGILGPKVARHLIGRMLHRSDWKLRICHTDDDIHLGSMFPQDDNTETMLSFLLDLDGRGTIEMLVRSSLETFLTERKDKYTHDTGFFWNPHSYCMDKETAANVALQSNVDMEGNSLQINMGKEDDKHQQDESVT